ncbi:MAG TPA: cbb3-type cytochrome c oxidase subunit I [Gemmatimonadales bacterium]|nr:cbb3-type cytochrome c oxidase subunit I [Gemmatimonadales bacterium]
MSAPVVFNPSGFAFPDNQRRALQWAMFIAIAAMFAGVAHGLAQALSYAGINILQYFPGLRSYYQGLTVHGVAQALVLTFAFSNGFLPMITARALGRPLNTPLLHATFWSMALGFALAVYALATNRASVLYTSYSPLQAHWTYYLGLTLVVVSTWLASANMFLTLRAWRREHRGARIPLLAYIAVLSYAMWDLASLGVAVLFVGFLLPWSIGWLPKVDPLFNRVLFWFTGHAIVYAWLLPAYVSWYALIPRQVSGKIISDRYTRFVFILFLLLSIPTGFHHQYTDPGITERYKAFHAVLTFGVFFPSIATAFSVLASLEIGGRARGGTGLLGWIRTLPWGDPSVAAQLLAMLTFVLGGFTGLVNASFTMNQVIHNTAWIPGHFHMTVGSAVLLTIIGVSYWAVPYLTGKRLWAPKLAVAQSWIYTIGLLIFARGMISGGLAGMPRRTFMAQATYTGQGWGLAGALTGIGGSIMTLGMLIFFLIMIMTWLVGKRDGAPADIPVSETLAGASPSGWDVRFDRIGLWVLAAILLIALAYGPFFLTYDLNLVSPGFRLF